jgi:amidohydrolase
VVSITEIHAGHAFNVIPDVATLRGTARTFGDSVREVIERRLNTMVPRIAEAFGATATLSYRRGYPVTVNDPVMADLVRGAATEVVGDGVVGIEPILGAEDFAYFLQQVPGCFFMVGVRNDAKHTGAPHHNPRFDIDEDALAVGMETLLRVTRKVLAR